jgi:hypothetical protein
MAPVMARIAEVTAALVSVTATPAQRLTPKIRSSPERKAALVSSVACASRVESWESRSRLCWK